MKRALLFFMILSSCSIMKESENYNKIDRNTIVFMVLNIRRDLIDNKHIIKLVSKTECNGKIKNQPKNILCSGNYLTIYQYNDKNIVDSIILEHPLYKHFEYLDDNDNFSVKDTIIDKADFFFRIQAESNTTKLKILETLKNKSREELITIEL
jgi:hypothetical protein